MSDSEPPELRELPEAPERAERAESRLVFATTLSALDDQAVIVVRLAPDREGRPREALVLRDETRTPRAYRNLCRHLPVPLDGGSRRFLFNGRLLCGTHGASYRRSDGLCLAGPCSGSSLIAYELQLTGDELYVLDAGQ